MIAIRGISCIAITVLLAVTLCVSYTDANVNVPIHKNEHSTAHKVSQLFDILTQQRIGIKAGNNKKCIACTLVVGIVEQIALDQKVDLNTAGADVCGDILSGPLHPLEGLCSLLLDSILPAIANDFAAGKSPDYSCGNTLNMCGGFEQCQLFATWPPAESVQPVQSAHFSPLATFAWHLIAKDVPEPKRTPQSIDGHHFALSDADGDRHAPARGYRGSQWHGADCNDTDATVYPGRLANSHDASIDHNCNGIYGADVNGNAYEELFCNVTQRGLIALGDSATAHFSIPPYWLNPPSMNNETYDDLIPLALSELDWPWCSWSTGHQNNSWCPVWTPDTAIPLSSIYQRMKARNKCMHRDYFNLGVNGGDSNNINPAKGGYLGDFARNQGGADQPATVFYALIGNDVCGKAAHYTDPATFWNNTMTNFQYLDTRLPAGSDVIAVGLVDGRVLYNTMHAKQHPIGTTYVQFYDYLNCLVTSPCFGWLNSNETIRNQTSAAAFALNNVYANITNNYNNFTNFNLTYVFPDFATIIAKWVESGKSASDLIEPTDGFHPSQSGNMLFAQSLWTFLESNVPQALGEVNPNNDAITAMFGDQGGYGN